MRAKILLPAAVMAIAVLCATALAAAAVAPLVDAVKSRDRAAALKLIDQRVDVNSAEPDGTTALHWAVHQDDVELADRLIKAGARVNAANDYGSTPMSEAAMIGNAAMIDRLLKAGANVESPNADGQTALMIVARTGKIEAAKVLLAHGANVNAKEQWQDQTALIWACAQNQPEMAQLLVASGADVNAASRANPWQRQVTAEPRAIYRPGGGFSALLYAAREGCLGCAKALAEGGADLNLTDRDGTTPLLMSLLNSHFDLAAYLIGKGANVNKWDWYGQTPLYAAVDLNTVPHGGRPDRPSLDLTPGTEVIKMLLKAGANPNAQLKLAQPYRAVGPDRGADGMITIGSTPLLRAAKAFDVDAIKLLIEGGAVVDLPNNAGYTPVMAAAGLGSRDHDTRGRFLTEDVQTKSIEALRVLIKAGADVNARDNRGQTPVHGAAFWGWTDVVQFLADNGAKLDVKDNQGKTPLDSAMGRAGGNSRGGQRVEVFPKTGALIEKLLAQGTTPKQ
jgi:serine/threonine-protein phosphatase 6 regulatory ankyrin repeat subunit B